MASAYYSAFRDLAVLPCGGVLDAGAERGACLLGAFTDSRLCGRLGGGCWDVDPLRGRRCDVASVGTDRFPVGRGRSRFTCGCVDALPPVGLRRASGIACASVLPVFLLRGVTVLNHHGVSWLGRVFGLASVRTSFDLSPARLGRAIAAPVDGTGEARGAPPNAPTGRTVTSPPRVGPASRRRGETDAPP